MKSVINFSAVFEKEHGVSFLPASIAGIVENMVSSDLLSGNSSQTYQCYIQVANFFLQRTNILNIIEGIFRKKTVFRTLRISRLDDETIFSSWTEEGPFLVYAACECARNPMKQNPLHAPSFFESGKSLLRELYAL